MESKKIQNAINLLMQNDSNATWDEVETVTELKECLQEAISNYHESELTYKFYLEILNNL